MPGIDIGARARGVLRAVAATGLVLAFAAAAQAEDVAKPQPHKPLGKTIGEAYADRPTPSLAVINAAGAKLEGDKLTLTGVSANTIVFADRPVRAAGHESLKQFLQQWDEGKNSFAADPPNATVSVLGAKAGEVSDVVVTLKAPKLEGSTLTFDVAVLEGSLAAGGPAALFIDAFAVRGPYGGGFAHVGGWGGASYGWHGGGAAYYHPPVYHGAWYARPAYPVGLGAAGFAAGAAVGAAAERAAPACGYYPYPPCY